MAEQGVQPQSVDLVVLGAGISGLTAARRAAARGLSVLVLEPEEQVGGRSASFDVAGVQVDVGARRLPSTLDPDVLEHLRGLLGDDLQTRPQRGRLRVAGQWISYPLRASDLAARMPRRLTLSAARGAARGPARRRHDDTYQGVLRSGLGPALYDAVFGPFARKLYGLEGAQLDPEQAHRLLASERPTRSAGQVLRRSRNREVVSPAAFLYPRGGFGQIPAALAQAAADSGARLVTGAPVRTLHARTDGVRVIWDGGEVHAAQAFSTVPLTDLGRVARPAPSAQVVQEAAGLTYRSMLLVYLVHEGGRWTSYDTHYLPSLDTPVARLSEPANFRTNPEDPADRTVLCAEIPCTLGDDLWESPDDVLAETVVATIAALGLPPVRLGGVRVRRLPKAYPVYALGYHQRLSGLSAWAERLAHVTAFGRLGLFVQDDTHHALRMGWDAADCLQLDGDVASPDHVVSLDHVAWQAARDRFRQHETQQD
ncbi:protoporphyrinogen/coproporphyrinogen oxidase [Angustibacter luteus]|uniref:Protoporphyrinogen/coproporphyrinogen oxidase n=1 Tax=Angustibacter luteus TaxID=658456 RepID=A0ABW1J901_9ACTN